MYIEITKLDEQNPLKGEMFRFIVFEQTIVLEDYYQFSKPTKRHKSKIDKKYCRLNQRESDLEEHQVVIPDNIEAEAIEKFIKDIKVCKWSEYKK